MFEKILLVGLILALVYYGCLQILAWLERMNIDIFPPEDKEFRSEGYKQQPYTYRPAYTPPPKPSFSFFGKKISNYLTDPNTKILEIFVAIDAVSDDKIHGGSSYSEAESEKEPVRLVRSGSGFRVYKHPNISDGKWLSCR